MWPSIIFKITIPFLLTLILVSCGKKDEGEVRVPPGIISEETFAKVLADFALAESAVNMNIKGAELRKLDSVYAFNPLVDNGITEAEYDSAIAFYVRHPELYKKVYENVLVILSEMQAKRSPVKKDTVSK